MRSAGKAQAIREAGGEAVVGDLADAAAVGEALQGAERLFVLTNSLPDQPATEARLVDAAKEAGVWQRRQAVDLRRGRRGPAALSEASPRRRARTSRRPASPGRFCGRTSSCRTTSTSPTRSAPRASWPRPAGAGRHADVDARDVGEVAARVLTESGHEGRAYELTGREAYSFDDVARRIGTIAGREVRFVDLSPEEGRRALMHGRRERVERGCVDRAPRLVPAGRGHANGSAVSLGVEEVLDRAAATPRHLPPRERSGVRRMRLLAPSCSSPRARRSGSRPPRRRHDRRSARTATRRPKGRRRRPRRVPGA